MVCWKATELDEYTKIGMGGMKDGLTEDCVGNNTIM